MSSIRYFNAFLLSCLTFALLYVSYLALPQKEKIVKPTPSKVIKIALVSPVKKVIKPPLIKPVVKKEVPKPIVAPILPPVPLKKVIKKKVIKKRIIKKHKPKKIVKKKRIVKKRVVKKRVVKKRVVKKKIIKKKIAKKYHPKRIQPKPVIKKKIIETPIEEYIPIEKYIPIAQPIETYTPPPPVYVAPKPVIKPHSRPKQTVKNNHHKKAFLRNVRSKIIANKTYPRIAKRRHIEGSVKVRFDITRNGQVSNIRFINGKRIFQKSIRKTLERTFPMGIPPEVQGDLPISDVSVVLHFNIR